MEIHKMTPEVQFIIGWAVGLLLFFICWDICTQISAHREYMHSVERHAEDDAFIKHLPRTIPSSGQVTYTDPDGTPCAIYSDGELVWDKVRGCVGKATYIP